MVAVTPLVEREDIDAILSGVFHVNATLVDIQRELLFIRWLLEDGNEEEEEEDSA
jgi:hypothetical protein